MQKSFNGLTDQAEKAGVEVKRFCSFCTNSSTGSLTLDGFELPVCLDCARLIATQHDVDGLDDLSEGTTNSTTEVKEMSLFNLLVAVALILVAAGLVFTGLGTAVYVVALILAVVALVVAATKNDRRVG